MHDIDRAMFELESHGVGNEVFESYETGGPAEIRELELASELLEITSEQELDRFLGSLISTAGSALGRFARSDTGRALGGILKTAAKQALPQVGQVLGDAVGMGSLGSRAGQWLGSKLEMEGLSAEDREFETARTFVRFAQDAARQAFETAGSAPAPAIAQSAAVASAQRHIPALAPALRSARPAEGGSAVGRPASGRWVRQGNRIILLGL